MDSFVRNLGFVQNLAVHGTKANKVEMSDHEHLRAGFHGDLHEELICPKPRRGALITSFSPEQRKFARPCRSISSVGAECEAGNEILDIFLSKGAYGESSSFDCSPPYFCGSPPSRAGNPLVHDGIFVHQRLPPASSLVPTNLESLSIPSFRASPSLRIEGFDCSRRDSRCTVPALA